MKNFRINDPDSPQPQPLPEQHFVDVGTRFTFENIGGIIKAHKHIPIALA